MVENRTLASSRSQSTVFLPSSLRRLRGPLPLGALLLLAAACARPEQSDGDGVTPGSGGSAADGSTGGGLPAGGSGTGGTGPSTGGAASGGAVTTPLGGAPPTTVECAGDLPAEEPGTPPHSLTVQGNVSWGDLPHFWETYGVGRMGLYLPDSPMSAELREHTVDGVKNLGVKRLRMHGLFHDDVGIYKGDGTYDFSKSDEIFDFWVENGIEPIVELADMPSALAADPSQTVFDWKMIVSPPSDYGKWRDLVQAFVAHSVERYGAETAAKWYYEVWNEPECCSGKFWKGTLDDYFKLYDYSAAGVRAALPNGRVGGPVSSQSVELTSNSRAGIRFLDHVTKEDNYALPGEKPVLDFFAFHTWAFVGGAVDGYFEGLDLLDSYGFTEMPIAITEFGPTWEFGLEDEPAEMTIGATFVAQVYSDVSRRVVQEHRRFPIAHSWWVLSDVFDEGGTRDEDPFPACMGLTSREGIHKPAYNVYKFLAQMGSEQLPLDVAGEGDVGGLAAHSADGGIQILIYHGQNPGPGPNSTLPFNEKYYTPAEGQDITVTLEGLDPDVAYDVTTYRVDSTHGNAYGVWEDQGRPNLAAMTDANWQALRGAMDAPEETVGKALCGSTYRQTFNLESPGVVFVKLTPAVQ